MTTGSLLHQMKLKVLPVLLYTVEQFCKLHFKLLRLLADFYLKNACILIWFDHGRCQGI